MSATGGDFAPVVSGEEELQAPRSGVGRDREQPERQPERERPDHFAPFFFAGAGFFFSSSASFCFAVFAASDFG